MEYRFIRTGFISALLLLAAGKAQADTYNLTGLGTLGGNTSTVTAVSADGSVVTGFSDNTGNATADAFIWHNGSFTDLGNLGGTRIEPLAISADGSTVVGYGRLAGDNVIDAFIWKNGVLNTISGGLAGGSFAEATVVSANGSVAAGQLGTATVAADLFRWNNGVTTDLGALSNGGTDTPTAISADGSVIAGLDQAAGGTVSPFIWKNGSFTDLGGFGGTLGTVTGLSSDGTTAAGYSYTAGNTGINPFVWKNGTLTNLGTLGGAAAEAVGISADGSTVIGYSYLAGNTVRDSFIWKNGVMTDIGTLGGIATLPTAVSADGSVVAGYGLNTGNASVSFFRWTQATGVQSFESILTQHGISYAGWTLSPTGVNELLPHISANGKVIVGNATLNGNNTAFIFYDDNGVVNMTTPQALMQDLAPATYATHQIENFFTAGSTQSLVATQSALSSFSHSTASVISANPQDIEPAAGGNDNPFVMVKKWSAYALGSFGIGQSNNFGNYNGSGTTGLFARVNDDLAAGVGLIGGGNHTDLQLGGKMDVTSYGVALNMDYEPPSGLRIFGTVNLSSVNETINRDYLNASTLEGSHGETKGLSYGTAVRTGYQMPLRQNYTVMPYAELDLGYTQLDAYTETGGSAPGTFGAQRSHLAISRIGAEVAKPVTNKIDVRGRLDWGHDIDASGTGVTVTAISLTQTLPYSAGGQSNWIEGGVTGIYQASGSTRFIADLGLKAGNTPEPDVTATFGVTVGF